MRFAWGTTSWNGCAEMPEQDFDPALPEVRAAWQQADAVTTAL